MDHSLRIYKDDWTIRSHSAPQSRLAVWLSSHLRAPVNLAHDLKTYFLWNQAPTFNESQKRVKTKQHTPTYLYLPSSTYRSLKSPETTTRFILTKVTASRPHTISCGGRWSLPYAKRKHTLQLQNKKPNAWRILKYGKSKRCILRLGRNS